VRRTNSYDEDLSKRLRNPKYAREFILGMMDGSDGLSVEDALRHTIQRMGIKEFAELVKMPSPNIVAFIKGRRHHKSATLDHLLKPFKLRTKLILESAS
jgi:hypothetical protein